MKITITFHDQDAVYECVTDAVEENIPIDLAEDEQETLIDSRRDKELEKLKQWIEDQEYLTVIFDTSAKTATVKESR